MAGIYSDGFHDIFIAHKSAHTIWQLRNGQVAKIFGSLHGEAGHINGKIEADIVGGGPARSNAL